MRAVLDRLRLDYPQLTFTASSQFAWSPETNEVFYDKERRSQQATWSLLHETAHGLLGHTAYHSDVQLLKLEVAAWDTACKLAQNFGISIDSEHIQDCLDTYRDWLAARSICPTCTTKSLQLANPAQYRCHNCHASWTVHAGTLCSSLSSDYKSSTTNNSSLIRM